VNPSTETVFIAARHYPSFEPFTRHQACPSTLTSPTAGNCAEHVLSFLAFRTLQFLVTTSCPLYRLLPSAQTSTPYERTGKD
jgi:hypothetical protein